MKKKNLELGMIVVCVILVIGAGVTATIAKFSSNHDAVTGMPTNDKGESTTDSSTAANNKDESATDSSTPADGLDTQLAAAKADKNYEIYIAFNDLGIPGSDIVIKLDNNTLYAARRSYSSAINEHGEVESGTFSENTVTLPDGAREKIREILEMIDNVSTDEAYEFYFGDEDYNALAKLDLAEWWLLDNLSVALGSYARGGSTAEELQEWLDNIKIDYGKKLIEQEAPDEASE